MKTIAIANQKGGTGKTTTAYNLGIALTQQGYRVLMVDFDPQGNLSCYCGIPPEQDLEQTITELLMKVAYEKPLSHRECVYQSKRTDDSAPQVDFIPSNLRLASFELAMGTMMCREVLLKTCLEQYSSQYDYCIIDCSPSVGLLLTNALSAANEVIIPMQAQPLEKRYHQLREMPYNNERTWNERARFPYARLVVGVDRQNPDGEVSVIQVRNGINYLCDDYRGPYADGSDAQIPQMAKKLVEVIGVDRVRPHTYTQRDGYTWVQVEKNMHITEWLYAHELCNSLQFTRFLNRDGRELFQVRDGQRVIETNADGTKRIRAVKSIDVTHAYVGHYGCHIQQYAEDNFRTGCYVAPEHPQPGDNLDKLQIYQITKGGCEYRFMNYAYSKSRIHAADYSSVYIANLPADYDLDRCFQEFNAPNRPLRYHMCSLSTSDIVVTTKNGKETAYYVDSIGFKDVSHLLPELHEVEAQRQKEQVQDEPER